MHTGNTKDVCHLSYIKDSRIKSHLIKRPGNQHQNTQALLLTPWEVTTLPPCPITGPGSVLYSGHFLTACLSAISPVIAWVSYTYLRIPGWLSLPSSSSVARSGESLASSKVEHLTALKARKRAGRKSVKKVLRTRALVYEKHSLQYGKTLSEISTSLPWRSDSHRHTWTSQPVRNPLVIPRYSVIVMWWYKALCTTLQYMTPLGRLPGRIM